MSTPPWSGHDEPDYMPGLRRHFADSMAERLQAADRALADLKAGRFNAESGSISPAAAFHLFAHSLSGTAPGVGASEIGNLGYVLSQATRAWENKAPDEEQLGRADDILEAIRDAAETFRGWVDAESEG